jgi:hypothetical protein
MLVFDLILDKKFNFSFDFLKNNFYYLSNMSLMFTEMINIRLFCFKI